MDSFSEFCNDIFATMYRADQRRAGELYVRGLLRHTDGESVRKSVRSLAAAVPGRSEQALQQFISQSPWDPVPIRRRLVEHLTSSARPAAYVIDEVAFPKYGRYSAAVDRQYVRALGRVCNCQLAVVVLLTGHGFSVPVSWRLVVPDAWGTDKDRRARARLPDHELPRPYWQYQIEALEDLRGPGAALPVPVLTDASTWVGVEHLFEALEARGQSYLVQVSPSLSASYHGPLTSEGSAARPTAWRGMVDDLVGRIPNPARETVEWRDGDGIVLRSQFLRLPVRPLMADRPGARPRGAPTARALLCEWPAGGSRPRQFWVTNMVDRPVPDLVALAKLAPTAGPHLEQLAGAFGLRDYEGRTFAGWHHHVTLVAAACTYHVLDRQEDTDTARSAGAGAT